MISELGPRVSADVERERKLEEERRAELRKRLEEKREREKQGKKVFQVFSMVNGQGTSLRTRDNRSHTQSCWLQSTDLSYRSLSAASLAFYEVIDLLL